jgi:hypothetical protein
MTRPMVRRRAVPERWPILTWVPGCSEPPRHDGAPGRAGAPVFRVVWDYTPAVSLVGRRVAVSGGENAVVLGVTNAWIRPKMASRASTPVAM